MRIHHIGYLVKDIYEAIPEFENLGYLKMTETTLDKTRQVFICFMQNGGYNIELVQPNGSDSPLAPMLKKIRNAPYHICYECDDYENRIKALRENGNVIVQDSAPASALGGRRVSFFLNVQLGLFELLEGCE